MVRIFTVTIGLCVLSGCTMFKVEPKTAATNDVLPMFSAERTGQVPEGARVEIERRYASADTRAKTTGVVLKSSPEGLALANCMTEGRATTGVPLASKLPFTGRLFKNTGIAKEEMPVLWVPTTEISSVRVLKPSPEGFVAPTIEIASAGRDADTLKIGIKTADEETPAATEEKTTPALAKQREVKSTQDAANVATQ